MQLDGIHHVSINVSDVPAAQDFYVNVLGLDLLDRPDFGDRVEVLSDEEPVFWACGVTPQAVALTCKPSLLLAHGPGRMFVTDHRDVDYAVI